VKFWRWIVAVIGVVLIVLVLQTSAVKSLFGGATQVVGTWVSSLMYAPERAKLMGLQDRFLRNNMSLKPHQTDYVYEVTQSIDRVRDFNRMYCISDDKNPYLYGNNLMKFCSDIEETGILNTQ
jgi:hypothetical protein